jgi:tetratricopeptide (TPR) repeat protein
MEMQN